MAGSPGDAARPDVATPSGGLRRSIELFRAFRVEQTDPDHFYRVQAADSVAQLSHYAALDGRFVVDVGGGAGYFTEALVAAGARCVLVEPESHPNMPPPDAGQVDGSQANGAHDDGVHDDGVHDDGVHDDGVHADGARANSAAHDPDAARREMHRRAVRAGRLAPGRTVAGDGNVLPFLDGVADVTFSSNVLEHVPSPARFLDEMVRVTRPGGIVYLSFTAWYSPWGGHETAPWHYLGGHRAARRYERRMGRPPGNRFGSSLFACHVGPTLRLARAHPGVDVIDALPRYYPHWMRWVIHVPVVREVATWNLLLVLRRRPAP